MIYLDYAASTPCDQEVLDEMLPYFTSLYANPANISNSFGVLANQGVLVSRNKVAKLLNCLPQQIIWTSGATESNNLALMGALKAYKHNFPTKRPHVISSSLEHKSVIEPLNQYLSLHADVSYLRPGEHGAIDLDDVKKNIRDNTFLISIMMANNETGVINDVDGLAKIGKSRNILIHTDATQYAGKIQIDLKQLGVDFLSFSGHKIYGPKGIGVLFVRNNYSLFPIAYGGGQEDGLRSGTLNVPGIVGIGKAIELCSTKFIEEFKRLEYLRDKMEGIFLNWNDKIVINGINTKRLPNISNITFPVRDGFNALKKLEEENLLVCSTGSACETTDSKPSHVMKELGKTRHQAKNTLRFSIGRFTSEQEILQAAEHVINVLKDII